MNELYHHGVKGMKWGVRRYQRTDGTRTSEGKRKENENISAHKKGITKKHVITGLGVAAGIGAGAYLATHPAARALVAKNATQVASSLKRVATSPKTKEFVKKNGQKALSSIGKTTKEAGSEMYKALLASVGAIKIAELSRKLDPGENATQEEKDRNKIILDTASAGIRSVTKVGSSNSNNKSNTNDLLKKTRNLESEVGRPKGIFGAEGEKAYQELFKQNPTDDQRVLIKAMRKNGYSADQIEKYVYHSDLFNSLVVDDFSNYYKSVEIGKKYFLI